jgi:hypothetical protein
VKLAMDFRSPEIAGTFLYHCHLTGQFFLILRLFQSIQLRRNSEQSLVKAPKREVDFCVSKLTAVHLQQVASGSDGLADSRKIGGSRAVGNGGYREAMRLRRIQSGRVEFDVVSRVE